MTARTSLVPSIRSTVHTPRFSATCRARSAADCGSWRSSAASTARMIRPKDSWCTNGATWTSTYAAAAADSRRVSAATRRALHAGTSPAITRPHSRRSRSRSSTACPT